MRSHYRRRSMTSFIIWSTALIAVAGGAAWQFHWWPTNEAEWDPLATQIGNATAENSSLAKAKSGDARPSNQALLNEEALFAAQSEPEISQVSEPPPFDSVDRFPAPSFSPPPAPKLLPANPEARPIESRLIQTMEGELPPPRPEFKPDPFPMTPPGAPIQFVENQVPAPAAEPVDFTTPKFAALREPLKQIDALLAAGTPQDELAAHKELSKLYWSLPDLREALRGRIEKTAKAIYFSRQPDYMPPYTIQPGDQLTKIGKLYHVPWEYLAQLNKADPRKIRPGQKLKVIKGPFAAVVDLHRFELTIQHHGFYVKRYKVGVGKDGTTPIGEFTVKNKLTNPTYYGPEGVVIAADDPQNPLGEYWIDLGDSYGIHGTIDPNSIGKAESRGCLRMLNEDAAEVYGFLGLGSSVIIRR